MTSHHSMPVIIDTSVVANGNGINSLAFPALTTTESNEILLAGFHFSNTTPTAVTFDGSLSWNLLTTLVTIPTAGGEIMLYWARAVQMLAGTVFTATFTGGGFPQVAQIISTYKGVNMANPIGAINSASSPGTTSISAAITTQRMNSLCVAFTGMTANNAMAAGTGQTEVNETTSAGGFSRSNSTYTDNTTPTAGTSVTMNTTFASAGSAIYAIELIDGSRPSFQVNSLRPRVFAPGLAR